VEITKFGKFKGVDKTKKKSQIILINSNRVINDYIQSLKYRYCGKYTKIPHYIITRDGVILQLLNNNETSLLFRDEKVNKQSIVICLENLGWLEKEPLSDQYINWVGDIYKGCVVEKKWRDYFFWQPYEDKQIDKLVEVCNNLFEEMSIKENFVGHNTKINGIEKFEGVSTRSNYDSDFTDVSPSFNFEVFIKKIHDEKLTR